jgi:cystathionine beta-lyase
MSAQHGPFDFDLPVDRRGTDARKWGDVQARWGHPDVLPMPLADMDFRVAPVIQQALATRLEHGVFGYTRVSGAWLEALCAWMSRRHGWRVTPDQVVPAPGVVPAAYAAVRALCPDGGGVVVQPPLYPRLLGLEPLGVEPRLEPLAEVDGHYRMDLDALEARLAGEPARVLVLCNPHNPVGRAWSREELEALGSLCLRHELWVVADEVFGDLCQPGQRFTPFASLSPELAARTVTCTSASKAFNLAGLSTAAAIVPDPAMRQRVRATLAATGFTTPGPFGLAATVAAYEGGEPWLEALLPYLATNASALEAWLSRALPRARLLPMEAGYLAWIDLRAYGSDADTLYRLALDRSRVALVRGTHFGAVGEGFLRMNLGCPRATLREALDRLERGLVPALETTP